MARARRGMSARAVMVAAALLSVAAAGATTALPVTFHTTSGAAANVMSTAQCDMTPGAAQACFSATLYTAPPLGAAYPASANLVMSFPVPALHRVSVTLSTGSSSDSYTVDASVREFLNAGSSGPTMQLFNGEGSSSVLVDYAQFDNRCGSLSTEALPSSTPLTSMPQRTVSLTLVNSNSVSDLTVTVTLEVQASECAKCVDTAVTGCPSTTPLSVPVWCGLDNYNPLSLSMTSSDCVSLPTSFDWPTLPAVQAQGSCGDCYAVANAMAATARVAGTSGWSALDNSLLSYQSILSCTTGMYSGCQGGYIVDATQFLAQNGAGTCSRSDCSSGCFPYTSANIVPGSGDAANGSVPATCTASCASPQHYTMGSHGAIGEWQSTSWTPARETVLRAELMTRGPFVAQLFVLTGPGDGFENFFSANPTGVYGPSYSGFSTAVTDSSQTAFLDDYYLGSHAVVITGWGVDSSGVPYWRAMNSWGTSWGDAGFFKIRRGSNTAWIEALASFVIPPSSQRAGVPPMMAVAASGRRRLLSSAAVVAAASSSVAATSASAVVSYTSTSLASSVSIESASGVIRLGIAGMAADGGVVRLGVAGLAVDDAGVRKPESEPRGAAKEHSAGGWTIAHVDEATAAQYGGVGARVAPAAVQQKAHDVLLHHLTRAGVPTLSIAALHVYARQVVQGVNHYVQATTQDTVSGEYTLHTVLVNQAPPPSSASTLLGTSDAYNTLDSSSEPGSAPNRKSNDSDSLLPVIGVAAAAAALLAALVIGSALLVRRARHRRPLAQQTGSSVSTASADAAPDSAI